MKKLRHDCIKRGTAIIQVCAMIRQMAFEDRYNGTIEGLLGPTTVRTLQTAINQGRF